MGEGAPGDRDAARERNAPRSQVGRKCPRRLAWQLWPDFMSYGLASFESIRWKEVTLRRPNKTEGKSVSLDLMEVRRFHYGTLPSLFQLKNTSCRTSYIYRVLFNNMIWEGGGGNAHLIYVYESIATVGEIRVWWRAGFQSGSRVLKRVFWTFSYLYLWHTMWFQAKKLLKTLKFWKSLNSLCKSGSRPQKSPKKAQKTDHSIAIY